MDRRRAILALASCSGALAVAPALSQQAKARRIGLLSPLGQGDPQTQSRLAAFEDELRRLGWRKGTDVALDYRFADGNATRVGLLAKELLDLQPDVVVALGGSSATAFRQQTLSVPIVFVQVADPIAAGFVTNLARPEGNITGFTNFDSSIGGKWLQAIRECAPKVNRVALVFDPTNPVDGIRPGSRGCSQDVSGQAGPGRRERRRRPGEANHEFRSFAGRRPRHTARRGDNNPPQSHHFPGGATSLACDLPV